MRSTTPCRISSSAMRVCRARTPCGWSVPTTPALRHRWSLNGNSMPASRSAPISRAKNSSPKCGNGKQKAAAKSRASCAGLAAPWIGKMNASPWMRAFQRPSSKCLSIFIIKNCCIATNASSTGTRALKPRFPTLRWKRGRSTANSGTSNIR